VVVDTANGRRSRLDSLAGAALPDVRHGEKKQDLRAVASNGKGFSVDQ
jgi:hypothetical protein